MIKLECSLAKNITNCKLSTARIVVFSGQKMNSENINYSEIKKYDNTVKLGIKS